MFLVTTVFYTHLDVYKRQAYEHNTNLHNLYTDYQHAFDNVNRTEMINDLIVLGIPAKSVRLTNATLEGFKPAVRVTNELTCTFDIKHFGTSIVYTDIYAKKPSQGLPFL